MANIHKFDVSNCDIRTQLMWEPWATIASYKIITLLLAFKGKGIYSIRNIGHILDVPKSTVFDSMKLLINNGYVKEIEGRFYITTSFVRNDVHMSEEMDSLVRPTGQGCPDGRTKVSGLLDTNNNKEIIIKNNDKVNEGLPPAEDPDLQKSKFWDVAGYALESPDDPNVQNTNQFMTTGRRPLKKHPLIYLTQSELSRALEIYEEFGVPIDKKKIYQRAFLAIEARLNTYKSEGKRTESVSCFNWLIGWALQDLLNSLRSSTDLKRSQKYLEEANGHARR